MILDGLLAAVTPVKALFLREKRKHAAPGEGGKLPEARP